MICDAQQMRVFPILAFLLSATTASLAADAPKPKAEEPGTHVQMPFLIAPVSVDGKLAGYVYISSKLIAATPMASVEIRDKLAFIQDAFVRDVNAAPIAKSQDIASIDRAALGARLVADAKRIVGAAKVVTIEFTQIQFATLHPKATTEDAIPPSQRGPQPAAQTTPAQPPATAAAKPAPEKPKTP
jgi:hypothetical protein